MIFPQKRQKIEPMRKIKSLLGVFGSRKMAALLFLGFSSGLPLLLIGNTLKAWMTVEKVDLAAIGWFSLASLPYSLKFCGRRW